MQFIWTHSSPMLFLARILAELRKLALFFFIFFGIGAAAFAGEGRLALVVGNQAYQNVPRLANPGNDARGVSEALRRLGFEVTLLTDVNTEVFNVVVKAFAEQAKSAEAVVFYYSGHAFQIEGQNHLLPVSAQPDAAGSVDGQTWKLDDIIGELQSSEAQTLVFLDACRTSPVAGRSGARDGLAQMQTRAGTFISFATRPGAVSFDRDGESGNSPYTAALLKNVEQPGLSISDLMIKVRNDVEAATGGQQTPWDQSSLRAQFFFNPAAKMPELPAFEIVQSDTIISPPPGGIAEPEAPEQMAALAPQRPGPVVQTIEAQDQSAGGADSDTRAAALSAAVQPPVSAPIAATPVLATPVPPAAVSPVTAPAAPQLAPPIPSVDIPEDIASAVQTELKRVGCYNMRIDGDWGNGSRRALSAYLEKIDGATDGDLEPTPELYLTLLKEPEGICPPVVVRTAPKAMQKKVVKRNTTAAPKQAATKAPAPAAPAQKKTKCTFLVVAIVCK